MRKHAFLIRWVRDGRIVRPVLDAYVTCIWPLGPEDTDNKSAQALVAMLDGAENLPPDVLRFCSHYMALELRMRYANAGEMTGPYIINDVEDFYTDQSIQEWLQSATDAEIHCYHHAAGRRNRHK